MLVENTSVHATKMKRIKIRCVIYTDSKNFVQSIGFHKVIHPILNKICNNFVEFKMQEKNITLCKVPVYLGIKIIETPNKDEKEATDVCRMAITLTVNGKKK